MKKILYIFLLLLTMGVSAQSGPNPFDEPKSDNTFNKTNAEKDNQTQTPATSLDEPGGGNPGDPLPIDLYIPFLAMAAVGMIVYTVLKKEKIQS